MHNARIILAHDRVHLGRYFQYIGGYEEKQYYYQWNDTISPAVCRAWVACGVYFMGSNLWSIEAKRQMCVVCTVYTKWPAHVQSTRHSHRYTAGYVLASPASLRPSHNAIQISFRTFRIDTHRFLFLGGKLVRPEQTNERKTKSSNEVQAALNWYWVQQAVCSSRKVNEINLKTFSRLRVVFSSALDSLCSTFRGWFYYGSSFEVKAREIVMRFSQFVWPKWICAGCEHWTCIYCTPHATWACRMRVVLQL